MRCNFAHVRLVIATISILTMVPVRAHASHCSQAGAPSYWAYTYSGKVLASNTSPAAAVGHFHQDAKGNVTGGETHTLARDTNMAVLLRVLFDKELLIGTEGQDNEPA